MATVGIYTLGCKVNQYESEAIAERFEAKGFHVLSPRTVCDVYVINTCTVTAESDRKSRQFIRRAIARNPKAYILVTGCLSQTAPETVAAIEGVDFVCGNTDKLSVVDAAIALLAHGKATPPIQQVAPIEEAPFEPMQIRHFDRTRAYIKIEDGCESHCTYCIIPKARGKIRSKPLEEVIEEVTKFTENGCREIVLTGIETASWGREFGATLADLLEAVDKIPHIGRVRLGSLDPSLIKSDFVARIAKLPSLAPHFHLSMQSGSDRILALMKRKYNTKMALDGMERLRAAIPDVQFTTDMILGFPNEGETEFQETMQFIENARFLMIHAFPYSARKGTPAAVMDGQVPEAIRHERVRTLSAREAEIRSEILSSMLEQNKMATVLFEDYKDGFAYGHTGHFIEVHVPAPRPLRSVFATVELKEAKDGVLMGTLADPSIHSLGKETI